VRWELRRFFSTRCVDPTAWNPAQHAIGAQCYHPPELTAVLAGELFVVLVYTDYAAAYSYGLTADELPAWV
jgi:hypothetical protein